MKTKRKRTTLAFLAVASLALIATACGGGSTPSAAQTTTQATNPPSTQSPSGGETSGETKVTIQDFMFTPSTVTASTGATIELENEGQATHTFTIDGQDVDQTVQPGTTEKVTIDLAAGSYPFHCKIHPSMTGTLTISG
jgi:plastocyanin